MTENRQFLLSSIKCLPGRKQKGRRKKKRKRDKKKKFLIIYGFCFFRLTPRQILNNAVHPLKRWQRLIIQNELLDKGSTKLLIEIDEAHCGEKSNKFPMKRRLKFWVIKTSLSQEKSWLIWRFPVPVPCPSLFLPPPCQVQFWFNLKYSICAEFLCTAQVGFFPHQVRKVNFDTVSRKCLMFNIVILLNVIIKSSKASNQDELCSLFSTITCLVT